jgi:hypothetical protein
MDRTIAILAETGFPKILWMEIAATIVYLKNRSPTRSLKDKTPYEAWFGRKPDLSHLKIIGTKAYVHIPKQRRVKLDSHSRGCQLVGYGSTANQFRVWDPIRKDIIISRDVIFDEDAHGSPVTIVNTAPARYNDIDAVPARYD